MFTVRDRTEAGTLMEASMKNSNEMCHPLIFPFDCFAFKMDGGSALSSPVSHYFSEFLLVQEGAVRLELDGEILFLRAGEAAVICPEAVHLPSVAEGKPRGLLIRLDPDRMPPLPDYSPGLSAILSEARKQRMPMKLSRQEIEELGSLDLIASCDSEGRKKSFGYDLGIILRLGEGCLRLVRFWLGKGLTLPDREEEELSIRSLAGYIQSHLRNGLKVEDLAEKCGLSYPWFAKKFRDLYGISCKEYIEQIRVARVEQFLRFTDLDLTQISEATGYADCSHMIKNFKRVMDITPGQFRQQQTLAEGQPSSGS